MRDQLAHMGHETWRGVPFVLQHDAQALIPLEHSNQKEPTGFTDSNTNRTGSRVELLGLPTDLLPL